MAGIRVLVGQDRAVQATLPFSAGGLRKARRGIRLADELGLPLATMIDTPGADPSQQAEESGLAGQVARCLPEMLALRQPLLAFLLGQGTGGGALALLPADRVVALRDAWLGPLPPEGASTIRFGDTAHAADTVRSQRIRAVDQRSTGSSIGSGAR